MFKIWYGNLIYNGPYNVVPRGDNLAFNYYLFESYFKKGPRYLKFGMGI